MHLTRGLLQILQSTILDLRTHRPFNALACVAARPEAGERLSERDTRLDIEAKPAIVEQVVLQHRRRPVEQGSAMKSKDAFAEISGRKMEHMQENVSYPPGCCGLR